LRTYKLLPFIVFILISAQLCFGAQTGKITGKVRDADTGKPLTRVNIIIDETYMGAFTDNSGEYVIVNVPPGSYRVRAEMMGYGKVAKTQVQIAMDQTTVIDFELKSEVLEVEEAIEIVAERPIIQKDVTASARTLSAQKLDAMPVKEFEEVLQTTAGVVEEGRELHFRGGRGGEALYMVDGMIVKDPILGGSAGLSVSNSSIDEMEILLGGFDAEYGEAQSAIINIRTKEGSKNFTGAFTYETDDTGFSDLNTYSFNTDFIEFSLGGPEPITNYILPKLGFRYPGEEISFFLSGDAKYTDTYTPFGESKTAYDRLGVSWRDRQDNRLSFNSKLSYRLSPTQKMTVSYRRSWESEDPYRHNFLFVPEHSRDQIITRGNQLGVIWNHSLSSKTYYDFKLHRMHSATWSNPGVTPDQTPLQPEDDAPWWEERNWNEWYNTYINIDRKEPFRDGDTFVDATEPWNDYGGDGTPNTADPGEGNMAWDAGETWSASSHDVGIDGIPGTGDFGEGDGAWQYYNGFCDYEDVNLDRKYSVSERDMGKGEWFDDLNGNGFYDEADGVHSEEEPYVDANNNGRYDYGERFTDLNGNGKWESTEPYYDLNDNGQWDNADGFIDGPRSAEEYTDLNGNGVWDTAEDFNDANYNGRYDPGEPYTDVNGNFMHDPGEPYIDTNQNGQYDPGESFQDGEDFLEDTFTDLNGNGTYDPEGEPFEDLNNDGQWNQGEPFTDLNGDGQYDVADTFLDLDGDGIYTASHVNGIWDPTEPYDDKNENGRYDGPNGVWDAAEPFEDLNYNGKWDPRFYGGFQQWMPYRYREYTTWTTELAFTSQVHKYHELRAGGKLSYHELTQWDIQYPYRRFTPGPGSPPATGPWKERGVFRNFWDAYPTSGAVYLQDKMEYEDLIVKFGLRYDWWWVGEGAPDTLQQSLKDYISPRLGISYPISLRDKMYFSYGHFSQMPELQYIYNSNQQGVSALEIFGNYGLESTRTVAYEFGVQHAFSENTMMDIKGFFKDQRDLIQVVTKYYPGTRETYTQYVNRDYGNVRGVTVTLDKRYSNYTSGSMEYSYQWALGKNSAEMAGYYGYPGADEPKEFPLDWDQRHSLTLNADLRIPFGDNPVLFGVRLPDAWGVNLLWQLGSGFPYTPTFDDGSNRGPANSARQPWTSTVDVILNKDFDFHGLTLSCLFEVLNVFDAENVRSVHADTGTPYGDGRFSEMNPYRYYPGRNIQFGFELKW
jgi:outer membrane receptor protein involved in Fe transport